MRFFLFILATVFTSCCFADGAVNYMRFNMGPKIEKFYTSPSGGALQTLPFFDVSAGLYLGHEFNKNFSVEAGIIRNDYSGNIVLDVFDQNTNKQEEYFKGYIHPLIRTYQLAILPIYRRAIANNVFAYGGIGVQFMLSRKLEREGANTVTEVRQDSIGTVISSREIKTYSNSTGPGFFVFRADAGVAWYINSYLQLDFSLTAKGNNLDLGGFKVEYLNEQNDVRVVDVSTKGMGLALNIGVKLDFN